MILSGRRTVAPVAWCFPTVQVRLSAPVISLPMPKSCVGRDTRKLRVMPLSRLASTLQLQPSQVGADGTHAHIY